MQDTAEEVRTNSLATFAYGTLHTYVHLLDDQIEPIYISSVKTQDVV